MLKQITRVLVKSGLSTGSTVAIAAGSAAVAAGVGYFAGRRGRHVGADVETTAKLLLEGSNLDVTLVAQPLLADAIARFIQARGALEKDRFVAELLAIRAKYGVATLNVVLYALAQTPAFGAAVPAGAKAEQIAGFAAETVAGLVGIEALEKAPESLLKSEDDRAKALVAALKNCFAAKQFVKPIDPPAAG